MAEEEFIVLYTGQKYKKAKTWHDGVLRVFSSGRQAVLYDDNKARLDSVFVRASDVVLGDQIESDRYLILVEARSAVPGDPVFVQVDSCFPAVDSKSDSGQSSEVRCRVSVAWSRGPGRKSGRKGFMPPRLVKKAEVSQQPDIEVMPAQCPDTSTISTSLSPLHGLTSYRDSCTRLQPRTSTIECCPQEAHATWRLPQGDAAGPHLGTSTENISRAPRCQRNIPSWRSLHNPDSRIDSHASPLRHSETSARCTTSVSSTTAEDSKVSPQLTSFLSRIRGTGGSGGDAATSQDSSRKTRITPWTTFGCVKSNSDSLDIQIHNNGLPARSDSHGDFIRPDIDMKYCTKTSVSAKRTASQIIDLLKGKKLKVNECSTPESKFLPDLESSLIRHHKANTTISHCPTEDARKEQEDFVLDSNRSGVVSEHHVVNEDSLECDIDKTPDSSRTEENPVCDLNRAEEPSHCPMSEQGPGDKNETDVAGKSSDNTSATIVNSACEAVCSEEPANDVDMFETSDVNFEIDFSPLSTVVCDEDEDIKADIAAETTTDTFGCSENINPCPSNINPCLSDINPCLSEVNKDVPQLGVTTEGGEVCSGNGLQEKQFGVNYIEAKIINSPFSSPFAEDAIPAGSTDDDIMQLDGTEYVERRGTWPVDENKVHVHDVQSSDVPEGSPVEQVGGLSNQTEREEPSSQTLIPTSPRNMTSLSDCSHDDADPLPDRRGSSEVTNLTGAEGVSDPRTATRHQSLHDLQFSPDSLDFNCTFSQFSPSGFLGTMRRMLTSCKPLRSDNVSAFQDKTISSLPSITAARSVEDVKQRHPEEVSSVDNCFRLTNQSILLKCGSPNHQNSPGIKTSNSNINSKGHPTDDSKNIVKDDTIVSPPTDDKKDLISAVSVTSLGGRSAIACSPCVRMVTETHSGVVATAGTDLPQSCSPVPSSMTDADISYPMPDTPSIKSLDSQNSVSSSASSSSCERVASHYQSSDESPLPKLHRKPESVISCQDPESVISCQDPESVISCQGQKSGISCQDPGSVISCQDPESIISCQDPERVMSCQDPKSVISCQDPNSVISCQDPKSVMSSSQRQYMTSDSIISVPVLSAMNRRLSSHKGLLYGVDKTEITQTQSWGEMSVRIDSETTLPHPDQLCRGTRLQPVREEVKNIRELAARNLEGYTVRGAVTSGVARRDTPGPTLHPNNTLMTDPPHRPTVTRDHLQASLHTVAGHLRKQRQFVADSSRHLTNVPPGGTHQHTVSCIGHASQAPGSQDATDPVPSSDDSLTSPCTVWSPAVHHDPRPFQQLEPDFSSREDPEENFYVDWNQGKPKFVTTTYQMPTTQVLSSPEGHHVPRSQHLGMTSSFLGLHHGIVPDLSPNIVPDLSPGIVPDLSPGIVPDLSPGIVPYNKDSRSRQPLRTDPDGDYEVFSELFGRDVVGQSQHRHSNFALSSPAPAGELLLPGQPESRGLTFRELPGRSDCLSSSDTSSCWRLSSSQLWSRSFRSCWWLEYIQD